MQENGPHLHIQVSIHKLKWDQVAGAVLEASEDKLANRYQPNPGTSATLLRKTRPE